MVNTEQLQAMAITHYKKMKKFNETIDHTLEQVVKENVDLEYDDIIFKLERANSVKEILYICLNHCPENDVTFLPEQLGMILISNLEK